MNKTVLAFILVCVCCSVSLAQEHGQAVDTALDVFENRVYNTDVEPADGNMNGPGSDYQFIELKNGQYNPEAKINETIGSLDIEDQTLEDVLDAISKQTGIVFIMPENVSQRISISVQDIDVWDLLKLLLQHCGLAYYRTNGAVHIMSSDLFRQRYGYDFPLPFPTKIVKVKYADMEYLIPLLKVAKSDEGRFWVDKKNHQIMMIDTFDRLQELQKIIAEQDKPTVSKEFVLEYVSYDEIKNSLEKMLTKGVGKAEVSKDGKILTVTDTEKQLKKIGAFLNQADKEVSMTFNVKILRINLHEEHQDGVDWEAIVSNYQQYFLESMNGKGSDGEKISLGTVTDEDYNVLVDALDTVGDLSYLLSFDEKVVLNKEESLDVETNDPFWSLRFGAKEEQKGPVVLDPNGFEMKANMVLRKKGDQVFLEFLPRLHWMQEGAANLIYAGQKFSIIEFGTSDVIVIGGLIRTEEISKTRKVPLLGDLPMVGGVFRRERKKYENKEYIIFLKPKINGSDSQQENDG